MPVLTPPSSNVLRRLCLLSNGAYSVMLDATT